MIPDYELKLNTLYEVVVIDEKLTNLYDKVFIVKFTGILFRSLKTAEVLFLSQIKVLKEAEEE